MQVVVQLALVHQLRVLGVGRLKLDGHLEVGLGVDTFVIRAKSSPRILRG